MRLTCRLAQILRAQATRLQVSFRIVCCSQRSKPEVPGKDAVSCVAVFVLASSDMNTTWHKFWFFFFFRGRARDVWNFHGFRIVRVCSGTKPPR